MDGNLIAERGGLGLTKLDWDSKPLWTFESLAHHDVWVGEDGQVWSLDRAPAMVEGPDGKIPILADSIVLLGPDGSLRQRVPVFGFAGDRIPMSRIEAIRTALITVPQDEDLLSVVRSDSPYDVFHTNSVLPIQRTVPTMNAVPGDLLVSIRELHLVAVVRPEPPDPTNPERPTGARIVWELDTEVLYQHHATLVADDHLLLFDNGRGRGYSRAVEIDPANGEVVWEYSGDPPESMYSGWRGSAQRLPMATRWSPSRTKVASSR